MKVQTLLFASIALLQGCASVAEIESRQLAYNGTGDDVCLWGGVTERAEAHCAEVRWGTEGLLMAVNNRVIKELSSGEQEVDCQAHVARAQELLAERTDLHSQLAYSCPKGSTDCHVSLMVSDRQGHQFVMDNGALLSDTSAASSVSSLQEYASLVDGNYRLLSDLKSASPIMLARQ